MNDTSRMDRLLEAKREDILKILRSYLSIDAQQLVTPEEILSEVVIYIIERSSRWEDRSDEYLLKCILWKSKRLIVDKMRRRNLNARAMTKLKGLAEERSIEAQTPQNPRVMIHREHKRAAIERFLTEIPSREFRQAVKLIWIEELTLREGAQNMGKSAPEFRKILRHGLQALMKVARARGGQNLITTGKTS